MRVLIPSFMMLLSACGGASRPAATASGNAGAPPTAAVTTNAAHLPAALTEDLARLEERFLRVNCEHAIAGRGWRSPMHGQHYFMWQGSVDRCITDQRKRLLSGLRHNAYIEAIRSQRVIADFAMLTACIDAHLAGYALTHQAMDWPDGFCREAFVGRAGEGAACFASADCASGFTCAMEGACPRSCRAGVTPELPVVTPICREGTELSLGTDPPSCLPPMAVGAACATNGVRCVDGALCIATNSLGDAVCRRAEVVRAEGAACNTWRDRVPAARSYMICDALAGLECREGQCRMHRQPERGAEYSESQVDSPDDGVTWDFGLCADGEELGTTLGERRRTIECVEVGEEGASCESDAECASDFCNGGACAARRCAR